ncbi:hypothetical protein AB6A40_009445 [Gnathostoma spinigerum]|uniref:Uncharacterized protein n=1 Tax=Gnathostoma spinigerum TaxID=75299 RepID=A0ABD6EZ36_9BILA
MSPVSLILLIILVVLQSINSKATLHGNDDPRFPRGSPGFIPLPKSRKENLPLREPRNVKSLDLRVRFPRHAYTGNLRKNLAAPMSKISNMMSSSVYRKDARARLKREPPPPDYYNRPSSRPDYHGGSSRPDYHGGSSRPDYHGGSSRPDYHGGSSRPDYHGGSSRPDYHGGSSRPDYHGGSSRPDYHP